MVSKASATAMIRLASGNGDVRTGGGIAAAANTTRASARTSGANPSQRARRGQHVGPRVHCFRMIAFSPALSADGFVKAPRGSRELADIVKARRRLERARRFRPRTRALAQRRRQIARRVRRAQRSRRLVRAPWRAAWSRSPAGSCPRRRPGPRCICCATRSSRARPPSRARHCSSSIICLRQLRPRSTASAKRSR